jgi:hypothetical protein
VAGMLLVLAPLNACGGATDSSGKSGSAGSGGTGPGRCEYGGKRYEVDEVFPSNVDCNLCRCNEDLMVSCGLVPCQVCSEIETRLADSLQQAKLCDPSQPNQCTLRVMSGPPCWCETLVNAQTYQPPMNHFFIYTDLGCLLGTTCGMCDTPLGATCSAEGRCIDN